MAGQSAGVEFARPANARSAPGNASWIAHESVWVSSASPAPRSARPWPTRQPTPPRSSACSTTYPTVTSCSFPSSVSPVTRAPTSSASRPCSMRACERTRRIARSTAGRAQLVVVGLPIPSDNSPVQLRGRDRRRGDSRRRSQAVHSQLQGVLREPVVRQRVAASRRPRSSSMAERVPFGVDLLFEAATGRSRARTAAACWWASRSARTSGCRCPRARSRPWPERPSCLNLSASNETIGKSRYRTDLVVGQSGRLIAAYAMAGCGPVGIDDRRRFQRPLPDRRERPASGRVAPRRRRPADPTATRTRSLATSTSAGS